MVSFFGFSFFFGEKKKKNSKALSPPTPPPPLHPTPLFKLTWQVLEHDAKVGPLRARPDELHDVAVPHLPHDVHLLEELGKLRRVGRDVAEDLDGDVGAAVGAAVEVSEGARGDALVADDFCGVELEVVGGRGRAREGRGRDEAVGGGGKAAVPPVREGAAAARGGRAGGGRPSPDRRQRSHAGLRVGSRSRAGVCGSSASSSSSSSSRRRVGPRGRQLRQPLGQDVLELVGGLSCPAVDDEDVEGEAVEGVEGVGLADV